jgi:hypothetical protein
MTGGGGEFVRIGTHNSKYSSTHKQLFPWRDILKNILIHILYK